MIDDEQKKFGVYNPFAEIFSIYKNSTSGILKAAEILSQSKSVFSQVFDQISNFNESLKLILPDLSRLSGFVEDISKFRDIEKKVFIESGWFICPSLNPVPYHYISKAVSKYSSGHKDSITKLMKSIYGSEDWKYLQETLHKWSTHRFFTKQRMQIIRDAFEAHKQGKYTLSIPALLPIIEGISNDFCISQKARVNSSSSKSKALILLNKLQENGEEYLSELVLEFVENQLYVSTVSLKNSKNRKYLNRHGILHGTYSGYPDSARSLRCFLLLDVLTLM